ncbi:BCL2 interacting protein 3 isoform X2 [Ptiloglossa arizonensis]|uniref:BCL2 interacting protein 3 isoform X2 n=1 Tax=Ptiloglossa arizonensis TaxID=3350558 RepID=UPI003FA137FC
MSIVKFTSDESLGESWVELSSVPDRVTPLPFGSGGEEYLRLLKEAQRDSTQSSARHSLASSRRDTPRDSPKSPPNSPNTELSTEDELKGVYINYNCNKRLEIQASSRNEQTQILQHSYHESWQDWLVLQRGPLHSCHYEHSVGLGWSWLGSVADQARIDNVQCDH